MKTCCPICGKELFFSCEGKQNPYHPFCSERCRWVDLGHWLEGRYSLEDRGDTESDSPLSMDFPESE